MNEKWSKSLSFWDWINKSSIHCNELVEEVDCIKSMKSVGKELINNSNHDKLLAKYGIKLMAFNYISSSNDSEKKIFSGKQNTFWTITVYFILLRTLNEWVKVITKS